MVVNTIISPYVDGFELEEQSSVSTLYSRIYVFMHVIIENSTTIEMKFKMFGNVLDGTFSK